MTECSTATDTHAAGAQDGSQSALTVGHNPTHMDPAQHTQHIIRTETAVCAHERGSGTRQHDSRHAMLAARTEGTSPNTIRPSTQPYCGSIVNRPTPYTQSEYHTFPTAQLPEALIHQVVAGRAVTSTAALHSTVDSSTVQIRYIDLIQARPSVLVRHAVHSHDGLLGSH